MNIVTSMVPLDVLSLGTLEETVRCIDDGKLSGSNYATRMPETIVLPTSEVTRVIRIMREQIEAVRLLVHERGGILPDATGWELLPRCPAANCLVLEIVGGIASRLPRVSRVRSRQPAFPSREGEVTVPSGTTRLGAQVGRTLVVFGPVG